MHDRIIEIEAKLAFAEDQIDALNRAVHRQREEIDRLQAQLRLLFQQMRALAPGDEDGRTADPRDEIPPHY